MLGYLEYIKKELSHQRSIGERRNGDLITVINQLKFRLDMEDAVDSRDSVINVSNNDIFEWEDMRDADSRIFSRSSSFEPLHLRDSNGSGILHEVEDTGVEDTGLPENYELQPMGVGLPRSIGLADLSVAANPRFLRHQFLYLTAVTDYAVCADAQEAVYNDPSEIYDTTDPCYESVNSGDEETVYDTVDKTHDCPSPSLHPQETIELGASNVDDTNL